MKEKMKLLLWRQLTMLRTRRVLAMRMVRTSLFLYPLIMLACGGRRSNTTLRAATW
jgi:hypothetical protein